MSAAILLLCPAERDLSKLRPLFAAAGADLAAAEGLQEALAALRKGRPAAIFLTDGPETAAEIALQEFRREAPFVPALVLLRERDSSRAAALLKAGAFDCAQPPWTPEEIARLCRKALSPVSPRLELDDSRLRSGRRLLAGLAAAFCLLAGFAGGLYLAWRNYRPAPEKPKTSFALPYSHPTGIVPLGESLLISDWHSQALYKHSPADLRLQKVFPLQETTPVALAAGREALWVAGADGRVEKRLPDAGLTRLQRKARLLPPPDGACFDGLYLWTANARAGEITKRIPLDDLPALATYKYPGRALGALACDNRFLWAADPGLKALLRLQLDNPEILLSSSPVKAYAGRGVKITALASAGGRIWFAGADGDKGFAYWEPSPASP